MEPVLHHYALSSFSEKVRRVLGYKGLAWRSVEVPAWLPKPDFTPLTAGNRRVPALQLGADIYCDTSLVCDVLEALAPQPTLFPDADRERCRAHCAVLSNWAETALFRPIALVATGHAAARLPADFHRDRAALHGRPPPAPGAVAAAASRQLAEAHGQLARLDALLGDGRPYLLGPAPSLADFSACHGPWFWDHLEGADAPLSARLRAWLARLGQWGHGEVTELAPAAALALAREAAPTAVDGAVEAPFEYGMPVVVNPLDQRSPASGRLLRLDAGRIVLAHEDPRCGTVHVHFPRLGYTVKALA